MRIALVVLLVTVRAAAAEPVRVQVAKPSVVKDVTLQLVARGKDHVLVVTRSGRAAHELRGGDDRFVEEIVHGYLVTARLRADGTADVDVRPEAPKLAEWRLIELAATAPGIDRAKVVDACTRATYQGSGRATVTLHHSSATVIQLGAYSGTIISTTAGTASCTPPVVGTIKKPPVPKGNHSYDTSSYPEEARKHGTEGAIRVKLLVDDTGVVRDAKLLNKLGHGLDEAALDRGWKITFEPALDTSDKPIVSYVIWSFNFVLPK